MHSEFYTVTQEAADKINTARKNGGKIIAVGTTSTRTLESVGTEDGTVKAGSGWTQIFIYPGYQFKVIDSLITNFHLPESTLVMLVSALAGREHVLAAYEEAGRIVITFCNFGRQIPENQLNTIFEKFYRLDAARGTDTGGAGLGLAIAKEIVTAHGGEIRADSGPEQTVFTVCLPA